MKKKFFNHIVTSIDQVEKKLLNYFRLNKILKTAIGTSLSITLVFQIACSTKEHNTLEIKQFTMPTSGLETIEQSERDIPVVGQADVVVAGGGVAGVASALKAAEEGLSVILIESRNYFGQELTSTYQCNTVPEMPAQSAPMSQSLCREMTEKGIFAGDRIDPQALRSFLPGKITGQPKIEVYLYSYASGVVTENGRVRGVVSTSRSGRQVVLAKVVIDATEDARIAVSAGARVARTLAGEKTIRRFISVRLPKSVPPGSLAVDKSLGFNDDRIMVHNGFVELAVNFNIGENSAYDLSRAQSLTLEKSFSLRDQLMKAGVTLDNFTPGPEIWIDEMPAITCRQRFDEEEINNLNFSNVSAVQPVGVEGLLITGRTVDPNSKIGSLQSLLCLGELAGKYAQTLAGEIVSFPNPGSTVTTNRKSTAVLQVSELLGGIESDNTYPLIRQSATALPVLGKYDVLVVGGGTSGALSAIAAARHGAKTAVVEILPNLGGISSNRVNGYYWGVPWKSLLRQELGDRIHLMKNRSEDGAFEKVSFSGEDKKFALQDLALSAGVHIYYQSLGAGAVVEGSRLKGIVVENASGRHVLLANVIIDATGNAGIAVAAGAGFNKGRSTDGFLNEIEHGPLRDPNNLADISASYLLAPSYAASMNVRESRRIIGDYIITFDDLIHERLFPDLVCRWRSNYDTHFPNSANQSDLAQDWTTILGLWRRPILGSIPYRCLLPRGLDNILVAGMAYSADHDALIGGRMQQDMEHLGEAAGVAAAMACSLHLLPREVPVLKLQYELVKSGVLRASDVTGQTITDGPEPEQLRRQDLWRKEREKVFPPASAAGIISLEKAVLLLGTDKAQEAMLQLYLAGDKSLPLLRPLLGSKNHLIHEEVAVVLGLLGDRSSVPALIEFLKERNTRRFEYKLPQASSRPSVPLYWTAVILLGRFGEKDAVPEMLNLLALSPPPEELGKLHRTAYGVDMFQSSGKCPPSLASFIIVALGRIGDPKAADAVRPFLKVSNRADINKENNDFEIAWGVKTNAAWALSKMGENTGVPALIELLEADQALLRDYAGRQLEKITGKKLGRKREAWEDWWKRNN